MFESFSRRSFNPQQEILIGTLKTEQVWAVKCQIYKSRKGDNSITYLYRKSQPIAM
jgi:hypothetical protein